MIMMDIVTKYGVELVPLATEHLELVRGWRNDPKIAQHMTTQTHITSAMQQAWFAGLNAKCSPHFVIRYRGQYMGLCSAKRAEIGARQCETGMYLYHDDPSTLVAFRAALAINDFCFDQLEVERICIYVMAKNTRALRFNEALGYQLDAYQPDNRLIYATLTPTKHEKSKVKIIRFLR